MKLKDFDINRLKYLENRLVVLSSKLYSNISIEEWQEQYWDRKIGIMLERNNLISDYQVDIARIADVFNNKYGNSLEHIYDTLHKEYDPLYNTDSTTDITSTDTYDTQNTATENTEINRSGTITSNTVSSGTTTSTYEENNDDNATTTNRNSGYNSNTMTDTSQVVYSNTKNTEGTNNGTTSGEDNTNSTSEDSTESNRNTVSADTGTVVHETLLRRFGNVGVTTNQKMITDEIMLRIKFNYLDILYKFLAEMLLDKIWEID